MAFDIKTVGRNDQVALVAGAVTVLLTLFPAYAKASVKSAGFNASQSHNAWVEWATLGTLLLVAAFVLVVLRVVVGNVLPAEVPWNLITAGVAGLGTLILVLYVFTFGGDIPSAPTVDVSTGPGWSGWLLLIAAIVFTAFSFLGFKDSGEKFPEVNKGGGTPPPAPPAGGTPPPAPPAGGTPPPAPPAPPAS